MYICIRNIVSLGHIRATVTHHHVIAFAQSRVLTMIFYTASRGRSLPVQRMPHSQRLALVLQHIRPMLAFVAGTTRSDGAASHEFPVPD